MNWLIDANAKVSVIMLLALGAAFFLRRRSAAARHWVFAMAVACAAVAPLVAVVAPTWQVALDLPTAASSVDPDEAVVTTTTFAPAAIGRPAPQEDRRVENATAGAWTLRSIGASVWIIGAGAAFLALLMGQLRLRSLVHGAQPINRGPWASLAAELSREMGIRRRVVLLEGTHPTLLGTWGLVRPKIVIPSAAFDWPDERVRIVLRHELAHIRRGDWAVMMTAACLRAIYWINPLLWIAAERVRQESEYACDDSVLNGGIGGAEYADHLVELARALNGRRSWLPAPAMARPSTLEGRINAMLNVNTNRRPPTRLARAATAIALLSATVSIAGFAVQSTFFSLTGSVVDATNRAVPKVTLTVINTDSEAKHLVKSDATGHFEFVGLPAGEYTLEASMPGFATFKDRFTIIARSIERNVRLSVGSLEETLTVTFSDSGAPQLPDRMKELERRLEGQKKFEQMRQKAAETCASGVSGGRIVPPLALDHPRPVYPENLRGTNTTGVVKLEALIGLDGTIQDVQALESPHPDLEAAATDAVRRWLFTQTLLNCQPVEVKMTVTMRFVSDK